MLEKKAKLLAHNWSSGCLATSCAIKKLFSVTMASHFEMIDEEYIKKSKSQSENEITKNTVAPSPIQNSIRAMSSPTHCHSFMHAEIQ